MMTMARFQQETGVEDRAIISAFEVRAATAAFPLNAVLDSVIGEQYGATTRTTGGRSWSAPPRRTTLRTWRHGANRRSCARFSPNTRRRSWNPDSLKVIPVGALERIIVEVRLTPLSSERGWG